MWRFEYAPIGEDRGRATRRRPRWLVAIAGAALVAGAGAAFLMFAGGERPARESVQTLDASEPVVAQQWTADVAEPTFTTFNEYTKTSPITWFKDVKGAPTAWKHLAEPWRESTFVADGGENDGYQYAWTIDGSSYAGRSVAHTFTSVGQANVVLHRVRPSTGEAATSLSVVTVKYVRREIRALTEADRTKFLDAMETIYRLPTAQGVQMYGPEYKGIEYFVQIHLDGAGVTDCDHWHDDAGIMTHHVGYTLQFEQALQVVDPSVTAPYWEYTLDEMLYGSDPSGMEASSPIFDDDWFGEMSPKNGLHTMTKGRWAYTPVAQNSWESIHNPYGLLRAPWNTDPTPYVTRHDLVDGGLFFSVVSCKTYSACFSSATLSSMNNCLNGGTHGPIHIIVGGSWGNKEQTFMQEEGFSDIHVLCMKALWRRGFMRFPDTCENPGAALHDSSAAAENGCKPSCPIDVLEANNMTPYDVLKQSDVLQWITVMAGVRIYYDDASDSYQVRGMEDDPAGMDAYFLRVLEALCDPGHVGEMYTPAAPYDPLFWVLHPSAERLLNARRLLGSASAGTSLAFDETWGYLHNSYVAGDMQVVCDWTNVKTSTDLPVCVSESCGGHGELDPLPFVFTLKGEKVAMTNAELLAFIYPTNDALPYMYDTYDWPWCAEQGYTMSITQ